MYTYSHTYILVGTFSNPESADLGPRTKLDLGFYRYKEIRISQEFVSQTFQYLKLISPAKA